MAIRRFSKIQKRKISIFFRCVVISFVAWTLFAISNTYIYHMKAGIQYVNLPDNKAFHPLQSDTVSLKVEMTGWKLLLSRFRQDTANIQVDLSGLKNRNWIVFSNQIGFINRQFPNDKHVVSVSPDTLYFDFSKQTQRKVPIKPVYSVGFTKQYGIIGDTKSLPEYVTITGPLEDVADIETWETDTIRGANVNSDIRTMAYLDRNQKANINVYPAYAEVTIPVGELTEKVLELPVKVVNASKYTSVRTLPTKVKVTILISLKDYNKWTQRDFEALVDIENWEENGVPNLPVILTKVPPYAKVVSIEPQNVDFFVRK
ncbi:hypothetical protein [Sphingobacterium sp. SYP-B4668]|uniref:hypothetical protein n=1 Tax=Sphingobacterium sp. SYP-B4668 TaxID=2996035 RepID=UPI0022DE0177|nr:hypothetical protein [Sphingobacterium sp. SYP-B4668]